MQENVPQWDPYEIYHVTPFENRLQVFYLLLTLAFFVVRVTQIGRFVWLSRKRSSSGVISSGELALAMARNSSLKRGAIFTILLSFSFLVFGFADTLRTAVTEKLFFSSWGFDGKLSEDLGVFALGVAVCTILYAGYALFAGKLSRRQIDFDSK